MEMEIDTKNEVDKMGEEINAISNVATNTNMNAATNIDDKDNLKQKDNKRKKIRRLADPNSQENSKAPSKCKRILIITGVIAFTVALLMGHYFTQNNINTQHIIKEFLKDYRKQYTQIVHGNHEYCAKNKYMDITNIFEQIKRFKIVNQDKALQKIELALRNGSDFNAISLVGPVGVGKTLFVRTFADNFPWPENVISFLWSSVFNDLAFDFIRTIIERLSDCGRNLIAIFNFQPHDRSTILKINNYIRQYAEENHLRVTIFYIFSLNTMLPPEKYNLKKFLLLTTLETQVVEFAPFTKADLIKCIQRESELENLILSEENIDEIVATIDPHKSGCKNVNAKVLMFGQPRT